MQQITVSLKYCYIVNPRSCVVVVRTVVVVVIIVVVVIVVLVVATQTHTHTQYYTAIHIRNDLNYTESIRNM